MSKSSHRLKMSFDPHTIEHLGVKMYSNLPNALAELIANAYDADARSVKIKLHESDGNSSIEVIDNGVGMTFSEINENFLRIGRNRRDEGHVKSASGKRIATGKKGLGKLAFFGIADTIEITTAKKGSKTATQFTMSWQGIKATRSKDYEPKFKDVASKLGDQGTTIRLTGLKRKSGFDVDGLANSLSKLFNLFDKTFKVYVSLNDEKPVQVDDKLKYSNLDVQFTWTFPDFANASKLTYSDKGKIVGKVISTFKPLKPGLRGVALFANGRLINAPEFFGISESSHGFSYFTGWLDLDYVDQWPDDVIATDRQSLNWDLPRTSELRDFLKRIMSELEKSWRDRRNETRRADLKARTNIDIGKWYGALPTEIRASVEPMVKSITEHSELSDEEQSAVLGSIHTLVPEYPYLHWRHLHSVIQGASESYYKKRDYYQAFVEAMKRYCGEVRSKSGGKEANESDLMSKAFTTSGSQPAKLNVVQGYKKRGGIEFTPSTLQNIQDGQMHLSMGIVRGARNAVQHEEIAELRDSGLFTEKDCLDALSLLSHLARRLDSVKTLGP
ncbi:MAG: TIGR02391 family protein [Flavobacteriales bacterium]